MRKFSSILVFILILAQFNCEASSDLERAGLIGKIRRITIEEGVWSSGAFEGTVLRQIIFYDRDGQEIESHMGFYKENNLLSESKWIRKRVPGKNLIESYMYREDGSLLKKNGYQYDDNGHLIKIFWYSEDDKSGLFMSRSVDDTGRELETVTYQPDGNIHYRYVKKFNKDGQVREEIVYQKDGSVEQRTGFSYDSNGRNSERVIYRQGGALEERLIFEYDPTGVQTSMTIYDTSGKRTHQETDSYEYDSKGNWVKWIKTTWKVDEAEEIHARIRTFEYDK